MKLVPINFVVPERLECPEFIIRKLNARDVFLDYEAVMSNVELIKKTRGGDWPSHEFTLEDDLIDLSWHQREFEHKTSFAFIVINPKESECLVCVYFYPPGWRKEAVEGTDVDVSFWVTQKAYDQGLYWVFYETIQEWLRKEWPFKNPLWTNLQLPERQEIEN